MNQAEKAMGSNGCVGCAVLLMLGIMGLLALSTATEVLPALERQGYINLHPAAQVQVQAASAVQIPAGAWQVTEAWTPTPGPPPPVPERLDWVDAHTGATCFWTPSTGVVCGGP